MTQMRLSEKSNQHWNERQFGSKRLKRKGNVEMTCNKQFFLTE